MMHFIFSPGFGFDCSFFQNLISFFDHSSVTCLDHGYFAAPSSFNPSATKDKSVRIGIGHSLGFSPLTRLTPACDYLIGLNAFSHFLGRDNNLCQKRTREFVQFQKRFIRSPQKTLISFYERCGLAEATTWHDFRHMRMNRLVADLNALPQPAKITGPTLIIGSHDDEIITKQLLYDNFHGHPHVRLLLLAGGKHGIGFHYSHLVYEKIMDFIDVGN